MYFPLLFLVQFCSSPSFSTAAGHCGKPSYCVWSWPHLSIPCNCCPASSGIDPLLASDLPPHSLAVSHHTHFGAPSVVPSCSAIYCACTHTHSSNSLSFIFIFLLPPPFSGLSLRRFCACCCCCFCFLRCIPLDVRWKTLSQSTSPQSLLTPATTDILHWICP